MAETKNDIQDRKDIQKLIAIFYEKLLQEEEFRKMFLEVAEIDVLEHLDIVVDFWESALFQLGKYKRDLLEIHLDFNQKYSYQLNATHFNRWLATFHAAVDELFEGENAKGIKSRAITTATIIKLKIEQLEQTRLKLNN